MYVPHCVLHPGKPCATNFPMKRVKDDSREEQGEAEKRRYRSASTWTTPRKRSISLQGPIRCTSPLQELLHRRVQVAVCQSQG